MASTSRPIRSDFLALRILAFGDGTEGQVYLQEETPVL